MAESESEMGFFTRTDSGSSLNEVLNQEFTHSKSRKSKQAAEVPPDDIGRDKQTDLKADTGLCDRLCVFSQ